MNLAFGHGGEDHGAPPPPVAQVVEPRTAAATEEFEVVKPPFVTPGVRSS